MGPVFLTNAKNVGFEYWTLHDSADIFKNGTTVLITEYLEKIDSKLHISVFGCLYRLSGLNRLARSILIWEFTVI